MLKWFLVLISAAGLSWFLWFQVNTIKISYVNGLPPYENMPGQEYILQKDCYVFAWRHPTPTAFPLLGLHARVPDLPASTSTEELRQPHAEVRLMDLIPMGTRFRILSVRREIGRRTGTHISYEIKFLDEVDRPYQRVDIRPIQLPDPAGGTVPVIDPSVAVPWIKR